MTTPLWTPHSGSESVRSSYSLMSMLSPLSSVHQPSAASAASRDAGRFVSLSDVGLPPSPLQPQPQPQQPQPQPLRPSPLQKQQVQHHEEEPAPVDAPQPAPEPAPQSTLECDLPETRTKAQSQPQQPRCPPSTDANAHTPEGSRTGAHAGALTREQRELLYREEGRPVRGSRRGAAQPPWLVRVARPLWEPLWATLRWVVAQVLGL